MRCRGFESTRSPGKPNGDSTLYQLTEDDVNVGLRFEIDKHRVSIRLTAPYSEERKIAARQQAFQTDIPVK